MKRQEAYAYLYDFLSQLFEQEEALQSIKKIILFGSLARGDFSPRSDIDLFIETGKAKEIEPLIKKELDKFEARAERSWHLRNLNFPIKVIVSSPQEERWNDLRREISYYGRVLFGSSEEVPRSRKPYVLVAYELKTSQKNKMAFLRKLYGYTTVKGKKRYSSTGQLAGVQGQRVGSSALLVPREEWAALHKIFIPYKVPYTIRDIWMEK